MNQANHSSIRPLAASFLAAPLQRSGGGPHHPKSVLNKRILNPWPGAKGRSGNIAGGVPSAAWDEIKLRRATRHNLPTQHCRAGPRFKRGAVDSVNSTVAAIPSEHLNLRFRSIDIVYLERSVWPGEIVLEAKTSAASQA